VATVPHDTWLLVPIVVEGSGVITGAVRVSADAVNPTRKRTERNVSKRPNVVPP
jgi:hypothetical protein